MSTEHTILKYDPKNESPTGAELCALENGDTFDLNIYLMNGDSLNAIHKLGRKMTPSQLEQLAIRILQIASYGDPELNLKEKYNIGDEELLWSARRA